MTKYEKVRKSMKIGIISPTELRYLTSTLPTGKKDRGFNPTQIKAQLKDKITMLPQIIETIIEDALILDAYAFTQKLEYSYFDPELPGLKNINATKMDMLSYMYLVLCERLLLDKNIKDSTLLFMLDELRTLIPKRAEIQKQYENLMKKK